MVGDKLKTVFVAVVISAVIVIIITICIVLIPVRSCVKIEAISDLQTVQIDDTLQVTWAQPIGQGNCPLIYRIQLLNGTDVIDEGETTEPNYQFLNVSFIPCFSNAISVQAVSTTRFGLGVTGDSSSFNHFGNIGPVENLQVVQENNGLYATWDPPIDSELCSLSYEVKLQTYELNVTFENNFAFYDGVNLQPCGTNMITVTPLGETSAQESLRGQEEFRTHFGEVGQVEDLQLELEGNALMVTWSSPDDIGECQLAYEVTFHHQGKLVDTNLTEDHVHVFYTTEIIACGVSDVSVTPIATIGDEEVRGVEVHGTHYNGLGPIKNLEFTQQTNGLLATWAPLEGIEHCGEVTYAVVLQTSDDSIQTGKATHENRFIFEEADLLPCSVSIISVTPIANVDGERIINGVTYSNVHFADIGPVEDLVIAQEEEGLAMSWGPPASTQNCDLTYEVSLWYDEDDGETNVTNVQSHVFKNADLRPCMVSEVSVVPIGRKDIHEGRGAKTEEQHFAAVGPVQDLVFQEGLVYEEEPLRLTWNDPENSELCNLNYQIQIASREGSTTVTENYYPLDDIPCYEYNVTVTPIVQEGHSGLSKTGTYDVPPVTEIGPVQNLRFYQNAFQWDPPLNAGECAVTFNLFVTINDEYHNETTFDQIFDSLPSCSEAVIEITAYVLDESESRRLKAEVPLLSLGEVQNLQFSTDRVYWEKPLEAGVCPIGYRFSHVQGPEENNDTLPSSQTHFYIELKFCTHHVVTVQAFYVLNEEENIDGIPTSIDERYLQLNNANELGAVQDLRVDANGLVLWSPPSVVDMEICPVEYSITLDGQTYTQNETYFEIPNVPCSRNELSVIPVFGDVSGLEETISHDIDAVGFGAVQNLQFSIDGVQWEKPLDAGVCPIQYLLTHVHGLEENSYKLPGSETHFPIELNFCTRHVVTVQAFYEEESVMGIPTSIGETFLQVNDPAELGAVQDLRVEGSGLVLWSPPSTVDMEICPVEYSLTLNRGFDSRSFRQAETSFQIPTVPCSNNELSVLPMFDDASGLEQNIIHNGTIVLIVDEAPELVDYSVSFDSITTVWRALGKDRNACSITHISISLAQEEVPLSIRRIDVTDNDDRVFTVEIGELLPGTDYSLTGAVVLNGFPNTGPASNALYFKTEPAPPGAPADFMKSKWDSPTASSAAGYEIAIRDNGPVHFLPRKCLENSPKEAIRFLTASATEYQLRSYLPNHNYTITVTSLGTSENYTFEEVSPEAKPGALDLAYEFVGGEENILVAVITWPIPCDVNGKLVKFSVEAEGKDVSFSEDITAVDGRENYSVEIGKLSEDSLYSVYVQTYIKTRRSDKSIITFKTPPAGQ